MNNGIRVVANFTEDRALLNHAIATLGVPSLSRIQDPLALAADFSITDLQAAEAIQEAALPRELVDSFARAQMIRMRSADEQTYLHNVGTLLEGLDGLAAALRGVAGAQADSLLLGRLRLARCSSASGAPSSETRARR